MTVDIDSGSQFRELFGHSSSVIRIRVFGSTIVSIGMDNKVVVWNFEVSHSTDLQSLQKSSEEILKKKIPNDYREMIQWLRTTSSLMTTPEAVQVFSTAFFRKLLSSSSKTRENLISLCSCQQNEPFVQYYRSNKVKAEGTKELVDTEPGVSFDSCIVSLIKESITEKSEVVEVVILMYKKRYLSAEVVVQCLSILITNKKPISRIVSECKQMLLNDAEHLINQLMSQNSRAKAIIQKEFGIDAPETSGDCNVM